MKKTFAFLLSFCTILSYVLTVSAATVSLTPLVISASGQSSDNGLDVANVDEFGFVADRARVPEDAEILVTLAASNTKTIGLMNVYKRELRGDTKIWIKQLSTPAAYGENGIYKTREGDKKTPVGTFKMNTPFGINAPLEGFPENYIQVNSGHYWDGDSLSTQYNRLVNTSSYNDFNKSSSEHIIDYTGYYNYCIDIGYNPDCTPYAGSAIYLHCFVNGDFDTAGCVAVPEEQMVNIMQLYEEGKSWMVIYDVANPSLVY